MAQIWEARFEGSHVATVMQQMVQPAGWCRVMTRAVLIATLPQELEVKKSSLTKNKSWC